MTKRKIKVGDIVKLYYYDHSGETSKVESAIKITLNWNMGRVAAVRTKPVKHIVLTHGLYDEDTDSDPSGDWTVLVASCIYRTEWLKEVK